MQSDQSLETLEAKLMAIELLNQRDSLTERLAELVALRNTDPQLTMIPEHDRMKPDNFSLLATIRHALIDKEIEEIQLDIADVQTQTKKAS